MTFNVEYGRQLFQMHQLLIAWRKQNPGKEAKVQFNFPAKVCVIAGIRDAIANGLVSVNDAGRELIEAICEKGRREPTVLMVRAVLEG